MWSRDLSVIRTNIAYASRLNTTFQTYDYESWSSGNKTTAFCIPWLHDEELDDNWIALCMSETRKDDRWQVLVVPWQRKTKCSRHPHAYIYIYAYMRMALLMKVSGNYPEKPDIRELANSCTSSGCRRDGTRRKREPSTCENWSVGGFVYLRIGWGVCIIISLFSLSLSSPSPPLALSLLTH